MLNVDAKNLRGVGIQVAKLDKSNESNKGQNKSILNFLTKSPMKPILNNSQQPGPSNAAAATPAIEVGKIFTYQVILKKYQICMKEPMISKIIIF